MTRDELFAQGCAAIHDAAVEALQTVPATLKAAGNPTPDEIAGIMEWQQEMLAAWARDAIAALALSIYGGDETATRH